MTTTRSASAIRPKRTQVQPHRLGMGWHYVWRHEPPMELVEQRAPALAVRLPAWCAVASHRPSGARRYDKSAYPARSATQASWRHFAKEESYA